MGSQAPNPAVHLVLAAVPAYGHTRPMRALARSLRERGFPVTFISGSTYRQSIEAIEGVEFVALAEGADFNADVLDEAFPERTSLPKDASRTIWDMKHIFVGPLAAQSETLQAVFQRPELEGKKVVLLCDAILAGVVPMLLEAPALRRVPNIAIAPYPLVTLSKDIAPFGFGLPPQSVEKNMELNEMAIQAFSGVQKFFEETIKPYQCKKPMPSRFAMDNILGVHDLYLQLSMPQLEYPRSDLPPNVRFIGTITGSNDKKPLPDWFESFVVEGDTRHPLVMVTSGTMPDMRAEELLIPTIRACTGLAVRLVVCAVRIPCPADLTLPDNVRWAEWIPFEELFKYTDIVVSNGGYGGITQAFSYGIPMICAGETEDKTETSMRAAMTGAAINVKTQTPSVEQVKGALENMLSCSTYKEKAMELKKAAAKMDAVESVVRAIDESVARFYGSQEDQTNGHL